MRSLTGALFIAAIFGALGCDYLSKRGDRQELDGLNLYIDLAIAHADHAAIEFAKYESESAHEYLAKAENKKVPAANIELLSDRVRKADEELAKAIDTAARHRHR